MTASISPPPSHAHAHRPVSLLGDGRPGFADEREVDVFIDRLAQFERGEISPDEWRGFRLVHGVYGQRQDDAMMIRVKIPQGVLGPRELVTLAEVAERWAGGLGHVTTRQNVQFHFVHPSAVEDALRHLARAGLTTREACGNAVRTITGCPYAGVAPGEPFDVSPYAEALTRHLLRKPFSSTLPRKFKIAVGGCCGHDDVQAQINDLGFLARTGPDGRPAFRVTIGGGLATLRRAGFLAHEAAPAEDILEIGEAVVRVFHRVGNRENRAKARLKWAIEKLGVAGFRTLYEQERAAIRAEGGRSLPVDFAVSRIDVRRVDAGGPGGSPLPERVHAAAWDVLTSALRRFLADSVRPQKQKGYAAVLVRLQGGALTAAQLRALAALVSKYGEGELRTTNEQNLVLRHVPEASLPALARELDAAGLARPGAGTVADVVSCPGASSCKIAVTNARGLAALLAEHIDAHPALVDAARALSIKISGCPNGCGQHYVAGVGFQGGMRKVGGRPVPQYLVYLGGGFGATELPEARFGRLLGKIPARRAPEALERLIALYAREKQEGEAPDFFFARVALEAARAALADLFDLAEADATAADFVDLGETAAFELVEGVGECAA